MRQGPERHGSTGLNRREFLGVGALPLAAGLAATDFGAKSIGTEHEMKTTQSAQTTVRVGLMGAGGIVRREVEGYKGPTLHPTVEGRLHFPEGVCDWTRPGVGHEPQTGVWLTTRRR